MKEPVPVCEGVYMVGGPELSDPRDCLCYLVVGRQARVLIDCGAGPSAEAILELAARAGGRGPTHLLLTHAHIDHAGGAALVKGLTGCQVLAHQLEAATLASGDPERSAAGWYGLKLEPLEVDLVVDEGYRLELGPEHYLHLLHTPGHTPGSLVAWGRFGDKRVLFGQDIHGPFYPAFGSDLGRWRESMARLLELEADILAEGHYGIFKPAQEVAAFIEGQLRAHR